MRVKYSCTTYLKIVLLINEKGRIGYFHNFCGAIDKDMKRICKVMNSIISEKDWRYCDIEKLTGFIRSAKVRLKSILFT